ncbi:Integrase core domain-containing protein [Lentzea xinjiangensis]|uniref:Integrase core domain-containing protein n=1 Tax=Lentzea xinjiangensis TaxID=402600 RepID=A0A1H9WQ70_9PSEU|nr:integrase core domain-containing protein [Lentzea xinjiangensis]SES36072.1 Integrase core domain-containing protein [Lentzea xinjiangensis]
MIAAVLVRFAYLAVSHAFAALWLLRMTDREKDVEILALRHQLAVLQRQLGGQRPRLRPEDRALFAALLVPLASATLRRLRLLASPDTVLRWHRDLMKRRHARMCVNRRPGRPHTVASIRQLVLRLATDNPSWGYRRIHGELALLGVAIAASTVWEILKTAGVDPAPRRTTVTWADFLRSQAEAILAMDSIETVTLNGQRQYVLAAIHHASRRVRIVGTTAHPTHAWVTQAIRNLLMDLEDTGHLAQIKFLIRDRDAKYPALIDKILGAVGITTVPTGLRMPRMNSITERWVRTLRTELLDRTLIWNQTHLRHALREYERHYNGHRTHRSLAAAAPLRARPRPLEPDQIERLTVDRRDHLGGVIHEYHRAA